MHLKGVTVLAHETVTKGRHSELLAQTALLANGWQVSEPIAPEPYDLVAREPISGKWFTIQVKTARIREDRNGAIVVNAKKGNGTAYTLADTDLFIGVLGNDVFMFKNRELGEYSIAPDKLYNSWQWMDTRI